MVGSAYKVRSPVPIMRFLTVTAVVRWVVFMQQKCEKGGNNDK